MNSKFIRLKAACYTANITMAIVGNLSPLLFLTFRTLYDISYSLLGLLVLINFFTQLMIDLVFSFFSHKFNITWTVRIMPILGAVGLLIYALDTRCAICEVKAIMRSCSSAVVTLKRPNFSGASSSLTFVSSSMLS